MTNLWNSADAYELYMGRWSRGIARQFVAWVGTGAGASWLDVGCGTGELTRSILQNAEPSKVVGVEPSRPFVEGAEARTADSRARFEVGDAQSLPDHLREFDTVVSGLVLNFIPDRQAALDGMLKAVRKDGTVAAYVWDYADGMAFIRYFWDAAIELDPAASAADESTFGPICTADGLEAFFVTKLRNVEVTELVVPTVFTSFDDYWRPFLGGVGTAPAFAMSLAEPQRDALRERLHERLPVEADGSIRLTARAWAAKGIRQL